MRFTKNTKLKRPFQLLTGMLALAALLTGCGGDSLFAVAPAATPTPTPASTAAVLVGDTHPSDELYLSLPADITCNPLRATTAVQASLHSMVFDSLFTLDDDGQLVSDLVESYEWEAGSGLCRIKLRQDAIFHKTGETVTAADVVYSYNTLCAYDSAASRYTSIAGDIVSMYVERADGTSLDNQARFQDDLPATTATPTTSLDSTPDNGEAGEGNQSPRPPRSTTGDDDQDDTSVRRRSIRRVGIATFNPHNSSTSSPAASPASSPAASPASSPAASSTGSPAASPTGDPTASSTGSPAASPNASTPNATTATSSDVLVVRLANASYQSLYALTFPVISQSYYGEHDLNADLPCGTGPYEVTDMTQDAWTLHARDASYPIQTITVTAVADGQAAAQALLDGTLDAYVSSQASVRQKLAGDNNIVTTELSSWELTALVPNCSGALEDARLRQAILYTLDRKEMLSRVLTGHGVNVDTPVPTSSFLYAPKYSPYFYNLTRGQQLFEEAGWTLDATNGYRQVEGQPLVLSLLTLSGDSTVAETAKLVVSQLKAAGVQVEVNSLSQTEYAYALASGSFDLALHTYTLPESLNLAPMLGSDGTQNYCRYFDSTSDSLLLNCRTAADVTAYKTASNALQQRLLEELPLLCLWVSNTTLLSDSRLQGCTDWRSCRLLYNDIQSWSIQVAK